MTKTAHKENKGESMKRIMITIGCLLLMTPALFAVNGGLGIRLGYGQNDPKFENQNLNTHGEVGGVELLEEWDLSDGTSKIGAKLGFDIYGKNKYSQPGLEAIDNTFAVPLSVYYKKSNENWSWFAGGGLTWISTTVKAATSWGSESFSKSKIFPHLTVGTEYQFGESCALGLDLRYNIAAKISLKEYGYTYVSDRSGFNAAITARYYFPMDTASWM